MKKLISVIFCCFFLSTCVYSQEAQKIIELHKAQCGDFSAAMDIIFFELQNSPDSKLYVIYYGRRYAKEIVRNKKTKTNVVILKYPHREDGLNYAKSIHLYFVTTYPKTADSINNRIVLVNGGFREDLEIEIWHVMKNGELPKPTPTLSEKDLKFSNRNPLKTRNYANCYSDYR